MKKLAALSLVSATVLWAVKVNPGGDIYGYYLNALSDPDTTKVGYNEFGVARAYMNLNANFIEDTASAFGARARITYDIEKLNSLVSNPGDSTFSAKSTYIGMLKYAYCEVGAFRGMPGALWIGLGQIGAPWIGYEEDLWKFRGIQKVFVDKVGLMSSADRGISLKYDFPKGFGAFQAIYMNGEGYKTPEVNEFKDMAARISVFPLASMGKFTEGLGIHGYYQVGKPDSGMVRDRMFGGVSYIYAGSGVMFQYLASAEDGDESDPTRHGGMSGWARLDLGNLLRTQYSFGIVGRYDLYDPNVDTENDKQAFILGGAYFNLTKGWTVALDYQTESLENSDLDPSSTMYLHMIGKF